MPTIAVNLGTVVSAYADLPHGSYLGEIAKIKLLPARQAGKFAQLIVTYLVIDGSETGRRQSQFLSLSPNAMGFVKEFFAKFGLGELPELVIDDDTEELTDPDLYGSRVIFKVAQDSKDAERTRVSLVSVEESSLVETPVSTVRPPAAKPDEAAAKAAAKAARIAAAEAALAAAAEEDEEEEEAAPAPAAPAPRTAAPRPVAPSANGSTPTRRTLR